MPPLDDNTIEDLEPSTSPALDEKAPAAPAVAAPNDADPSNATGETDDSLLSVVRDVVSESRKDQTASPAEGSETGQPTGDKTPKELDDENFSDVPFHKHPRFQQLLRKSKAYEADAVRYNNVQTFIDNAGLSAEEAADGLTIMGLMKTNPVEAWQRLKQPIQALLVAAGEVLPEDLKSMVAAGKMDQTAALEVSRSRAGVQSMQVRQTFDEKRRQQTTQQTAVTAITNVATDWEADRRRNDPNFEAKMVPLQKELLFLQRTEGRPNTPEGVKAQLDKAYKSVNDAIRPAAPPPQRRPAIRPITGGAVAGNQAPEAGSTIDIIRARRKA